MQRRNIEHDNRGVRGGNHKDQGGNIELSCRQCISNMLLLGVLWEVEVQQREVRKRNDVERIKENITLRQQR